MRRLLICSLLVVVAGASLALVTGPTFLAKIAAPTSSVVHAKYFSAKSSGTGTADTLFVWKGVIAGLTDDATVVLVSGLDTTLAYDLTVSSMTVNQTGVAQYGINFADGLVENIDIDRCSYCTQVASDCSGTTGTDARVNTCMYTSGANGIVEIENRTGATTRITWELTGGG